MQRLARQTEPSYFIHLAIGGVVGAWLFGSLNSLQADVPTLSHSLAGALAAGIAAVEWWKWRRGIRASTGTPFVIPISIGVVIGRWGCLFAGLDDGTFGVPTELRWSVDLGDGVGRHPVRRVLLKRTRCLLNVEWTVTMRFKAHQFLNYK